MIAQVVCLHQELFHALGLNQLPQHVDAQRLYHHVAGDKGKVLKQSRHDRLEEPLLVALILLKGEFEEVEERDFGVCLAVDFFAGVLLEFGESPAFVALLEVGEGLFELLLFDHEFGVPGEAVPVCGSGSRATLDAEADLRALQVSYAHLLGHPRHMSCKA